MADRADGDAGAPRMDERTGLRVLDRAECEEVLQSTPIGRVVFVDDEGQPLALPVNYRWHESSIVFRTLEGQKLYATLMSQKVTFEVDHWNPETRTGVSVLVKGEASSVEQWAEREVLEQIGLVPWSDQRWRTIWVRVTPLEMSGRSIT